MSVLNIAFHRSTAVIVGVLWAAIVSRFWWPSEARRELSRELGEYVFIPFLSKTAVDRGCQYSAFV